MTPEFEVRLFEFVPGAESIEINHTNYYECVAADSGRIVALAEVEDSGSYQMVLTYCEVTKIFINKEIAKSLIKLLQKVVDE